MYLVLNVNVCLAPFVCGCVSHRAITVWCFASTGVCLSVESDISDQWLPSLLSFCLFCLNMRAVLPLAHGHTHTRDTLSHSEGSSARVDVNEAESFSSYLWHILQA